MSIEHLIVLEKKYVVKNKTKQNTMMNIKGTQILSDKASSDKRQ